jgi:predicted lipoprotein with Yx(FWY)xxD motif
MGSSTRTTLPAALIAVLALAVGCGGDEGAEPAATDQGQAEASAPNADHDGQDGGEAGDSDAERPGTVIATGDSQFGEALFGGERRAIYYFDKETSDRSECYGACAAAWPPVLTEGEPVADGAVELKLLGTIERDDGTTQVTYAGRPLYYYVDDPPGEILCHKVEEFGGLWLAVQPSGDPF